MSFSIPLAAILGLSTMAHAPEGGPKAVSPFVGDEVMLAARIDLAKLDFPRSARRILGSMADDVELVRMTKGVEGWVDSLKKAGATDLYFLVDLADMPGSCNRYIKTWSVSGSQDLSSFPQVACSKDLRSIALDLKTRPARPLP